MSLARRLTLDDVSALVRLADPQWSPDGAEVLVGVVRPDWGANQYTTELRSIEVATGRARTWMAPRPGIHHARWWPDGRGVVFLGPDGGHAQIFALDAPGGTPRRLTRSPTGVRSFAVHPTARVLAFAALDPPARAADPHNRAFEVTDHDLFGTEPLRDAHLWLVDADGQVWPLTSGGTGVNVEADMPGGPRAYAWSPDGRQLALLAQPAPGVRGIHALTLELLHVESGTRTPLTEPGALLAPRFASDGSRLVVLAPAAEVPIYSPNQAHEVVDRQLVPFGGLDRDLRGFAWLPSGGGVGWAADGTRGALWTLGDHEPYRWPLGYVEPVSAVSVGPEGQVAFVGSMPQRAPELYVVDDAGVPARRLTNVNPPPPGVTPGHVETVTWTGPDGTPQDGVLVRPPDFDPSRRYPLVLSLHGGPMAACTEGWVGLRQLLAAHGWLVFCPNYRGSNHRGTAFQTNVLGDPAEGPSADILAGVDALRQRGIVDDARRALSGWSYGGYLAAWLAATSEGWVGAVAGAPVVDWRDAYVLSDLGPLFGPTIGPSPWDAGPAWDAASPLAHLDTYTTPTLILACTGDQRVPITHAYRLFSGLKARGTEVRFVAYPVSGHAPSDPVHQRDVMRRWVDWLWRAFQPPGADASATAASRAGSRGPGGG